MEARRRTLAKAVSWQGVGLLSTTVLGWLATGSWSAGGALALSSAALGLVVYVGHERAWARVRWGIEDADRR